MKIKEVSEQTGLTQHTLRYYEKEGLLQHIKRDLNGVRNYTEADVHWVEFLKKMKQTHMPIKDIKVYADSYYSNNPDVTERVEILLQHKKRVQEKIRLLTEADEYIDYKLNYYQAFMNMNEEKSG